MTKHPLPTIEYDNATDNYSSVWVKYIRAVDLSVHCIDSLIGERHNALTHKARRQILVLDEYPTPTAWYLCGVTYPYRWADNAHLLAIPADGEVHEYQTANLRLTVHNMRPLEIHPFAIDPAHPQANEYLFKTCRNWQAAWMLHTEFALRNMPNPETAVHRQRQAAKTRAKRKTQPELF